VSPRGRTIALAVAAILVLYGAYRAIEHLRSPVIPAVITPGMDAHRAVARDPLSRMRRFWSERQAPSGTAHPRLVALTFDDGPYPVSTPLLLDMLADLDVRATFFLIGRDAQEFPDLTRRIAQSGHEIANHTLTHPDLDRLPPDSVARELAGGSAALRGLVSDPAITTMMRPPHGRFTEQTVAVAQRAGYSVILWTDDPGDWRSVSAEVLAEHVAAHATAPDIVLLHSGRFSTLAMLPGIVARFRRAGYAFVTVGELLRRVPVAAIEHPQHEAL